MRSKRPSRASAPRKPAAGAGSVRRRSGGEPGAPRRRRSFSQRSLAATSEGPLGEMLSEALRVPEEGGYALTHGFHAYPGRFHPALPRTVLAATAAPGTRVLDPFMGGGTTLVEALQQGLSGWGNDLNPVAVRVARERTRPRSAAEARRLVHEASSIAAAVEALRREKQPPRVFHPHQHELARAYAPHLLAELMQWHRLIEAAAAGPLRESLQAVFSSAVVKFSNLGSDSRPEPGPAPHYPKGAVSRQLVRKTRELAQAQVALAERIPPGTPPPVLLEEDARLLPSLGWAMCDMVLTSPPYPGTYDYHAQHRLRMAWLGLDDAPFAAGEIGARRESPLAGERTAAAGAGWSESLRAVLSTLARVLRPGGSLFLVMGDWVADDHAVDAAALLTRASAARDWHLESRASVQRDVHSRAEARIFARRGKWEHLLHLVHPQAAPGSPEAQPEARRGDSPRARRGPPTGRAPGGQPRPAAGTDAASAETNPPPPTRPRRRPRTDARRIRAR